MKKTTRWVCAVALGLTLYGPAVHADDGADIWAFIQALIEQVEQVVLGPPEGDDSLMGAPQPEPEIGILLPPGG
jgi:hypothetical protein